MHSTMAAGSAKFRAVEKAYGPLVEHSQKDCLLELFAHVVAMGCAVCVDLSFHFSDPEIVVRKQRISAPENSSASG